LGEKIFWGYKQDNFDVALVATLRSSAHLFATAAFISEVPEYHFSSPLSALKLLIFV